MKKLLLLTSALIMTLLMFSCKNDDPEPELVYKLEVDTEELTFECDATGVQYINVESENVVWNATVDEAAQNWITIEQTADRVSVTVTENIDIENREGIIRITPETDQVAAKAITVIQNKSGKEYDLIMTKSMLVFYGDYYEVDASNYELRLYSGDAEVVYDEDWDEYSIEIQNGYFIYLDMIATTPVVPDEYRNPKLAAGTYNCSEAPDSYEHMTFMKSYYNEEDEEYYNSLVVKYDGGVEEYFMIDAGSVRVDHSGNTYIVAFEFSLADGTTLSGFYKNEIDILYNAIVNSTIMEDFVLEDLSLAESNLYFWGDDGGASSWLVEMISEGLSLDDEGYIIGNGYYIVLDMYSAPGNTLMSGNYILSDEETEYTAYPGGLFLGIFDIGCYAVIIEGDYPVGKAYMTTGQIDVTNNGSDNYTFDINAQSDIYYKVDIDYTGVFTYIDSTRSGSNDKKSTRAFKVKAGKPKTFKIKVC